MATTMRLPNPAAFSDMSRAQFIEAITALFEAAPPLADHASALIARACVPLLILIRYAV